MNKAMARHVLKQAGWRDAEIAMAGRVLRHDATRRSPQVLEVLRGYMAEQTEGGERAAWERLTGWIEADPRQGEALAALLAL